MTSPFQQSAFENAAQDLADLTRQLYELSNPGKYGMNFDYDMDADLPSQKMLEKHTFMQNKMGVSHHDKLKLNRLFNTELPPLLSAFKSAYMNAAGTLCTNDWKNATLVLTILPSGWELKARLQNIRDKDDKAVEIDLKTNLHGDTMHRLQSHASLPLGGDLKTFVLDFQPGYGNAPYTLKAPSAEAAAARICVLVPHSYGSLISVSEKLSIDNVTQNTKAMLNGLSTQQQI